MHRPCAMGICVMKQTHEFLLPTNTYLLEIKFVMHFSIFFFQITSTFRGEFSGSSSDKSRETCIGLVEGATDPSSVLPVSSWSCSDNTQATVTVDTIGNTEVGNKCNENIKLVSSQTGDKCGKCITQNNI